MRRADRRSRHRRARRVALADARVALHRFEPGSGNWNQLAIAWTDADGRYRFDELTPWSLPGLRDSDAGITPTTDRAVPAALLAHRADHRLGRRDRHRSRLGGRGGEPPPAGARANPRSRHRHLRRSGGRRLRAGLLESVGRWEPGPWAGFDEEGGYELRVDGDRNYHVCFHPWDGEGVAHQCWDGAQSLPESTPIRGVRPNRTVDGIDARLDPGGRIEGMIGAYPVGTQGAVEVLAYRYVDGQWWPVGFNALEPWTSPTPFEVAGLPAGTYRVCFRSQDYEFVPVFADECVGGTPTPATGTDVEVTAGEATTGADVELGRASTIRGRALGIDRTGPGSASDRVRRADLRAPDRGRRQLRVRRAARWHLQGRLQPRSRRGPARGALLQEQAGAGRDRGLLGGRSRQRQPRHRDLEHALLPAARSPVASSTATARASRIARCAPTPRARW